jgi:hypothetical protein
MKRVADIQRALVCFGLNVPKEKIRVYEQKHKLFSASRNEYGQRSFTEKQYNEAVRNIVLAELGCPISAIQKNDGIVIKSHVHLINRAVAMLEAVYAI